MTVQPPPVADVAYISVTVVAPRAMQKGETLRCALPNGSFFQLPISGNIAAGTPLSCKVPQKAPPPQPVRFLVVPPGMGYGAKVTALSPNGHVAHVGVPPAPPPPGSRMAVPVPQEQAARFEGPTAYERLQQQRRSAGQLISRKARNHEYGVSFRQIEQYILARFGVCATSRLMGALSAAVRAGRLVRTAQSKLFVPTGSMLSVQAALEMEKLSEEQRVSAVAEERRNRKLAKQAMLTGRVN